MQWPLIVSEQDDAPQLLWDDQEFVEIVGHLTRGSGVSNEDLYELYNDHLSTLAVATHTDDADSFAAAMMVFLDKLDEQSQQ
jgi:hypothetical protein